MKNILLSIFLLVSTLISAQNQIKVEYELTPYFNPADKSMGMLNVVFLNSNYELIVDENSSSFVFVEKISNEQPRGERVATVQMGSRGTIFKNTADNIYLKEAKLGTKNYLIQDSLRVFDWSISKETKTILGFETRKATAVLDDKYGTKITAWYAPKLNFKTGPEDFWGLPGLILELESGFEYEEGGNEGSIYKALSVEVLKDKVKVEAPSKGEKVSRQEFKELAEQQYNKMMEMYGDGVDKD
ncbi:MAG: GLPGLI family protein [Weeksellaceae bacterium]|jgi:GLPGLI family protein